MLTFLFTIDIYFVGLQDSFIFIDWSVHVVIYIRLITTNIDLFLLSNLFLLLIIFLLIYLFTFDILSIYFTISKV